MSAETAVRTPAVTANGLTRRFGGVVAIENLSFDVFPGEIFGAVGADGSGKTTLLQLLAAILDPSSGSCSVLGLDSLTQAAAVNARIGYMSQGFTLYERLTVEENLAFAAAIRGVRSDQFRNRRKRLMQMAGLELFAGRRADRLSGGMRKKLALCANLIHEPAVLLLDEPGLGVDPLSRRELWQLLEEYRQRDVAIIVATSYMDEADRCDRVLFLHAGRDLALGSPRDLKLRMAGTVFEADTPDAAGVAQYLASHAAVRGVTRLPHRVRFQVAQGRTPRDLVLPAALKDAIEVPPKLEDLFAAETWTGPERAGSVSRHVASVLPPKREPPPGASSETTVHARDVVCRFGDFTAIDGVSLDLKAGEVFGFLGPNGAGKTTLIRILCGLQDFQAGDVAIAGLNVPQCAKQLRQRIGYMSQRFSLYHDLTALENLEFFAGVYGLRGRAFDRALAWAVDVAGLRKLTDRRTSELSGAVRQRLALACSVMHGPRVLFLDEPTSGVDPVSRHRFWHLVHDHAARGVTAFVTTHNLEEAAYCQRLGLMFQGRLLGVGTLAELRVREGLGEQAGVEELFLRCIHRARQAA